MDDCYQEVTLFLNIALHPDLDDILDLDASVEGKYNRQVFGRKEEGAPVH